MLGILGLTREATLLGSTVVAIVALVVLVARFKLNAFLALILATLFVGLCSGMPPMRVAKAFQEGLGTTLGFIAVVIGLGTMLGKMLAESGGAEVIANTFVRAFGTEHLHWALMFVGFIVGIPVFFAVGLVLLMPILAALARDTKRPLLLLGIPLVAGLSASHGLVPPHPGPMAAIGQLGANVGKTILYSVIIGIPTAIIAGPIFGKFVSRRVPIELGGTRCSTRSENVTTALPFIHCCARDHSAAGRFDARRHNCRQEAPAGKHFACVPRFRR